MKRALLILFLGISCAIEVYGQSFDGFEIIKIIESSPLKDQQSSGTCWSFATTSFIETEAIRIGKRPVSLSPIFYLEPTYINKAEKYIERKGESYFGAGDLTFSVMQAYEQFGAIPEEVYSGIIEDDWQHDHLEMDNLLASMVESIGTSGYGRIKPHSWKASVKSVLEAYLGKSPKSFEYKGSKYTPRTFADEFIGINPDDYLEITSYAHLPFYQMVELEIPANWNNRKYLNIPITDFKQILDSAIKNGYTLAWDGDASEPGANYETGINTLDDAQEKEIITQKDRQSSFEDGSTTDDHNMHVIGIAKDQHEKLFYIMKNSEGKNEIDGYILMSNNYLLLKTISLLVHKEAIPGNIYSKINFENR